MKKIQFQLMCSVITPPTSGPIASASADTPAQIPIAVPRWRGGNVTVMIERVERERISRDDPLELGDLEVKRSLDRRQRHVHDRVVEHDHEQAERDGRQRPPLSVLFSEYACSHKTSPEKLVDASLASACRTTSGNPHRSRSSERT